MRLKGLAEESAHESARRAKQCKSRRERHVVPHCYQRLRTGEPSSNGLEGGFQVQECWAKEAKERPGIHVVLKRLQHLYKDHRSRHVAKAMSAPPS